MGWFRRLELEMLKQGEKEHKERMEFLEKRPTDKLMLKVPMSQKVITDKGAVYKYHFANGEIHWCYYGCAPVLNP